MTKQDRLNIDLKGLRERIENHRDDPAWRALSMSKKIRLLIEASLEQSQSENHRFSPPGNDQSKFLQ